MTNTNRCVPIRFRVACRQPRCSFALARYFTINLAGELSNSIVARRVHANFRFITPKEGKRFMNIDGKVIWQHAAGDRAHEHVDVCLDWDVILSGPGKGSWQCSNRDDARKEIRAFCEEMQVGDIVVLKVGMDVYGVGVLGEYAWCDEFNDVDGWDLGHVRRVSWLWKHEGKPKRFERGPTRSATQRLHSEIVKKWLEEVTIDDDCQDRIAYSHCKLPEEGKNIKPDEIAEYLFDNGMASDSIRSLLDRHGEFLRVAAWYNDQDRGPNPSERETVSHLVVPLLRILGWTPQRMAVDWKNIDVALFSMLPRDNCNLSVVVEAKKVRNACLSWAVTQAQGYAESHRNCLRLIVTDGLRYGVFTRRGYDERFLRYAYLNLIRPRNRYSIYKCGGAREAILAMTPEWQPLRGT